MSMHVGFFRIWNTFFITHLYRRSPGSYLHARAEKCWSQCIKSRHNRQIALFALLKTVGGSTHVFGYLHVFLNGHCATSLDALHGEPLLLPSWAVTPVAGMLQAFSQIAALNYLCPSWPRCTSMYRTSYGSLWETLYIHHPPVVKVAWGTTVCQIT